MGLGQFLAERSDPSISNGEVRQVISKVIKDPSGDLKAISGGTPYYNVREGPVHVDLAVVDSESRLYLVNAAFLPSSLSKGANKRRIRGARERLYEAINFLLQEHSILPTSFIAYVKEGRSGYGHQRIAITPQIRDITIEDYLRTNQGCQRAEDLEHKALCTSAIENLHRLKVYGDPKIFQEVLYQNAGVGAKEGITDIAVLEGDYRLTIIEGKVSHTKNHDWERDVRHELFKQMSKSRTFFITNFPHVEVQVYGTYRRQGESAAQNRYASYDSLEKNERPYFHPTSLTTGLQMT